VNLNALVEELRKLLVRVIGEDIVLQTLLAGQLGAVRVDPGQIEQVLVNLVVNARDAMPKGGTLILETANVELDAEYARFHSEVVPGPHVLLAVSDTGEGMSEHVKQRLFEPFFTTKPKGRGTGLGLATIFGTIKQSGGSIEVYSELGKGTTFKVYLPEVEAPAERVSRSETPPTIPTGAETVLLVEDDESVRKLAHAILRRLGYSVLVAANGAEALVVAQAHRRTINLLMTDVVMPGMNGRELAEQLC
jgi:two-component system, cell cycle sensor histidine kinase and response regulator CckA